MENKKQEYFSDLLKKRGFIAEYVLGFGIFHKKDDGKVDEFYITDNKGNLVYGDTGRVSITNLTSPHSMELRPKFLKRK